jgi:energy-coupling factor transport system permease protein
LSYAVLAASAIILILMAKIPLKIVFKGLKAVVFVLLFTSVLNIFWTKGDVPLISWDFIQIYPEGIYAAIFIIIRIISLIIGTGVFLTYTTTPIALTDAIEDLLSPLKKLHVPVHDFAMMMTIALRFIPLLVEETDKIMTAQKARGADFSSGGIVQRVKALIPVIIPLFASAFNRAGDLAIAMECRCYHGGEGRTRMTVRHIRVRDFVVLFAVIALGASLIALNILSFGFTM